MADAFNAGLQPKLRLRLIHFRAEHRDDVFRGYVTKQLPQRLFMPCEAVVIYQRYKIPLRVTLERGFAEVTIPADEVLRAGVHVCEIAAPAARNPDLFTRRLCVIDDQHVWSRMGRAHHASSTCANDQSFYLHTAAYAASFVLLKGASGGSLSRNKKWSLVFYVESRAIAR